jgi:hypothetical protein
VYLLTSCIIFILTCLSCFYLGREYEKAANTTGDPQTAQNIPETLVRMNGRWESSKVIEWPDIEPIREE